MSDTSLIRIGPNPALAGSELLLAAVQSDPRQVRYAAMREAHRIAWIATDRDWKQTFNALQMWCWIRRVAG